MHILKLYKGRSFSPVCIILGAVHGNENAGVLALKILEKKLKYLEKHSQLKGSIIGIKGNSEAYKKNVRFIYEDMNRLFSFEKLKTRLSNEDPPHSELKATTKLIETIVSIAAVAANNKLSEIILLDIHTTSAQTQPFCAVASNFDSILWAKNLGVPIIRGLEEKLGGNSTVSFFNTQNLKVKTHAMILEVGQHESPTSVDFAVQSIIKTLRTFDFITPEGEKLLLEEANDSALKLSKTEKNLPQSLEVVYRHALQNDDVFRMQPNFKSFDRVTTQTLLAHHNDEPVYAPLDAYLLMPLYQKQGDDGFFLVQ